MDLGVADRAVLETGSTSGLGRATAEVFAAGDADVVVTGRNVRRLDETVSELQERGNGDINGMTSDLTNPTDIETLVATAVDEMGGLDHLVVSTGGPPEGLLYDISDEEWYAAFDLLAMSFLRLVREAAPHLESGGGTIVNVSSISVKETFGSLGLGSAVRLPEIGMANILARELGPDVRVNTVLTGIFETPRLTEHIEEKVAEGVFDDYQAGLDSYAESSYLDRVGDPIEMGKTIAFLSSDHASFITGTALPVDGGVTNSNH
jgi:NAD(P)-dependent dehydrogenase (short-subunit alcohol dehydrogenase family)